MSTDTLTAQDFEPELDSQVEVDNFVVVVSKEIDDSYDKTCGDLPVATLNEINKAFAALSGTKVRNAARAALAAKMEELMRSFSTENDPSVIVQASAYMRAANQLGAKPTKTRQATAPVDPTDEFVGRVAALTLAYQTVYASPPEGVATDWETRLSALLENSAEQAATYAAWLNSDQDEDAPEVPDYVRRAFALVKASAKGQKKPAGSRVGRPHHNVGRHLAEVFSNSPVGEWLPISRICSTPSDEYKGGSPAAGAVTNRAFPAIGKAVNLPDGLAPEVRDGKKGIVKVA